MKYIYNFFLLQVKSSGQLSPHPHSYPSIIRALHFSPFPSQNIRSSLGPTCFIQTSNETFFRTLRALPSTPPEPAMSRPQTNPLKSGENLRSRFCPPLSHTQYETDPSPAMPVTCPWTRNLDTAPSHRDRSKKIQFPFAPHAITPYDSPVGQTAAPGFSSLAGMARQADTTLAHDLLSLIDSAGLSGTFGTRTNKIICGDALAERTKPKRPPLSRIVAEAKVALNRRLYSSRP